MSDNHKLAQDFTKLLCSYGAISQEESAKWVSYWTSTPPNVEEVLKLFIVEQKLSTEQAQHIITVLKQSTVRAPNRSAETVIHAPSGPAPPIAASHDAKQGQIGSYTIIDELGHGGMGIVYRAKHSAMPGRYVALKVINPKQVDPESVARFQREVGVMSQFDHPNVAGVFDAHIDVERGEIFFAMPLIDGCELQDILKSPDWDVHDRMEVFRSILQGMAAVHDAPGNLIHRDLKPQNIMIVGADDYNQRASAIIMDFGLVKVEESKLSLTGEIMGTWYYMAPEQALGFTEAICQATDVFTLGKIFVEFVLQHSFHVSTLPTAVSGELGMIEVSGQLPDRILEAVDVSFSDKTQARFVRKFLKTSMAGKPENRFENAGEMLREFESYFELVRQARERVETQRFWLITSMIFAIFIIFVGIITAGIVIREKSQQEKALKEINKKEREKNIETKRRLEAEAQSRANFEKLLDEMTAKEEAQRRAKELQSRALEAEKVARQKALDLFKQAQAVVSKERMYAKASRFAENAQWTEALREVNRILATYPNHTPSLRLQGYCYFVQQDARCIDAYQKIQKLPGIGDREAAESRFWEIFCGLNLSDTVAKRHGWNLRQRRAEVTRLYGVAKSMPEDGFYRPLIQAYCVMASQVQAGKLDNQALVVIDQYVDPNRRNHWLTLFMKGYYYQCKMDLSQAKEYYLMSVSRNPSFTTAIIRVTELEKVFVAADIKDLLRKRLAVLVPKSPEEELGAIEAMIALAKAIPPSDKRLGVIMEVYRRLNASPSWKGGTSYIQKSVENQNRFTINLLWAHILNAQCLVAVRPGDSPEMVKLMKQKAAPTIELCFQFLQLLEGRPDKEHATPSRMKMMRQLVEGLSKK